MGQRQPQRMGDNRWEPLTEVCPECGSVNTLVMTMNSPDVVSRRCTVCAHVWRGVTSDSRTEAGMFREQPSASSRGDQQPLYECPKCASHNVGLGTVTSYSVYFRCRHCGEIWAFPDRRHVPRISDNLPMRRKTDKP